MNTLPILAAIALLGLAPIAGAQVKMPNPNEPGGSPNTAVRIVATNDIMIDRFIKRWLHAHYPGWDAEPYEFMEMGSERFAVVYITSPNNPGRRVYFRVVSNQNDPDDDGFPQL